MGNVKTSIRKRRGQRIRTQNKALNYLRLVYFLSKGGLTENKTEQLLSDVGINREESWFYKIKIKEFFQTKEEINNFLNSIKTSGLYLEKQIKVKRELWSGFMNQSVMEELNIVLTYKGNNPKATTPKFIDKVLAYQTFEDEKIKKQKPVPITLPNGRRFGLSYAEILANQKNKDGIGISSKEFKHYIREAKERTRQWEKDSGYGERKLTDKDIARRIYKNAGYLALQRVRQDRKRLRKYGLI